MDKIKQRPIKRTMTFAFLITIFIISVLSGITIFLSNRIQQDILNKRPFVISSYNYRIDKETGGYIVNLDENSVQWQPLTSKQKVFYYLCYVSMIGLPVIYIVLGIRTAAGFYYRKKLRAPITQLQTGMKKIQNNDLDFCIEYASNDELGQLCSSMEKMRTELRNNTKKLWRSLEERKVLNSSVAHDLRTPITVIRGYLDYLQKNIPRGKITEETLMETLEDMQGAVLRLENYVECVRDVEKIENIEVKKQTQNTTELLNEVESNIQQLSVDKNIVFASNITRPSINVDKYILFRIIENLLQNALRYAEKEIQVSFAVKDNNIVVSVIDDGNGFSQEDLKNSCDWFYGNDKDNEHFGIGLSVVKSLCEKHGGSFEISNNDNKGACVTAYLKII